MALERRQVRGADEALGLEVEAGFRRGCRQAFDKRARRTGEAARSGRELVGDVGVVAAEELVASLAGEGDLHVLGRQLGDEVGRQGRRVAEGLVERLRERGQEQRGVGSQHELAVAGAVALGDRSRTGELVERCLLKADREGAHGLRRLLCGERGERTRVDAARQQYAHRHVGDEMCADRVAKPRTALLDQLCLVGVVARRERAGPGEAVEGDDAVAPGQQVSGRELADLLEDRERRGNRVEGEVRLEGVGVDLATGQCVELRGEGELAGDGRGSRAA